MRNILNLETIRLGKKDVEKEQTYSRGKLCCSEGYSDKFSCWEEKYKKEKTVHRKKKHEETVVESIADLDTIHRGKMFGGSKHIIEEKFCSRLR